MFHLKTLGQLATVAGVIISILSMLSLVLAQDPLVGTFSDGQLQLSVTGGSGQYSGQISFQGQVYPLSAQGSAERLEGTFQAGSDSFAFQAGLQGNSLIFSTGGHTYQLIRQSPPPQTPPTTAATQLPAGTRLTYYSGAASHPGTNAGPDARGSGGTGYDQMTVLYHDGAVCLATVSSYLLSLMTNTLSATGSTTILSRDSTCGGKWMAPAALAQTQSSSDTNPTFIIERGTYQHEGRTYNALFTRYEHQDYRANSTYDLDTGILLMFTEGRGQPSGAGQSPNPTYNAFNQLIGRHQLSLPWDMTAPLPGDIQNLQSLSYQGSVSYGIVGSGLLDYTTPITLRFEVVERSPNWLLLHTTQNVPGEAGQHAALTSGGGLFIPPAALLNLQVGQVLDEDPYLGIRTQVAQVDATTVVISQQGSGFSQQETYDKVSGLMVHSQLESSDGAGVQTIRLELTGRR
jgi:hypothetical protein